MHQSHRSLYVDLGRIQTDDFTAHAAQLRPIDRRADAATVKHPTVCLLALTDDILQLLRAVPMDVNFLLLQGLQQTCQ